LTGSTGFIGKELVKKLLDKDYEVHTLERYVTGRYSLDSDSNMKVHYAELSDYPAVRRVVEEVQPEYCIHTAAISAVSFSYDHYIEVSKANYIGTINLAEACYREVNDFKQFLMAGTSEEYGMSLLSADKKITESYDLKPNSPYAVAKVASDLYLRYMHMAYEFPYTLLRPFNTYGRKDNAHFFIERTITQMLKQNEVYLGDPNTIRDWIYVDDHVEGYLKALGNKKAIGQEIQLCTGKGYTTKETAETIAKLVGFKGKIEWGSTQHRPLDAKVLIGDYSKAKELLDWEPRYTLQQGLEKTIEYWRKHI
jgi:nucleoside-diphosphate-sugar epimerase